MKKPIEIEVENDLEGFSFEIQQNKGKSYGVIFGNHNGLGFISTNSVSEQDFLEKLYPQIQERYNFALEKGYQPQFFFVGEIPNQIKDAIIALQQK